jgi:hypothetical protein
MGKNGQLEVPRKHTLFQEYWGEMGSLHCSQTHLMPTANVGNWKFLQNQPCPRRPDKCGRFEILEETRTQAHTRTHTHILSLFFFQEDRGNVGNIKISNAYVLPSRMGKSWAI